MNKVTQSELESKGGKWLAEARSWIQWTFHNGSDVTWGSLQTLSPKILTVSDIESLAAKVATAAINEYIDKVNADAHFEKIVSEFYK